MALFVSALTPASATAVEHIQVTREIFLERGDPQFFGDPTAIVRTHDGGYVIAGSIDIRRAWVARVDAAGKGLWQHAVQGTNKNSWEVSYEGAAMLPDDSAILCGYKQLEDRNIVGLVTHIDKA